MNILSPYSSFIMTSLYPLKFKPIFLDKIWGGQKIRTVLGKEYDLPNCGETWELSAVPGNISEVADGPLAGRKLDELIAEYAEAIIGSRIFENYGEEFPLLIKFISSAQDLSIQVHPDDAMAREKHNGRGKTEMWYILDADKGATLITGFNRQLDKESYLKYFESGRIEEILNHEEVMAGDVFYLPSGRIHTIGKGILLAEIQQTSDITYRIYDFDRRDAHGNLRELHTELAAEALDFKKHDTYKTTYPGKKNQRNTVVDAPYFTTNKFISDQPVELKYDRSAFHILIAVAGEAMIRYDEGEVKIRKGEVFLLPAAITHYQIIPDKEFEFLEVTA